MLRLKNTTSDLSTRRKRNNAQADDSTVLPDAINQFPKNSEQHSQTKTDKKRKRERQYQGRLSCCCCWNSVMVSKGFCWARSSVVKNMLSKARLVLLSNSEPQVRQCFAFSALVPSRQTAVSQPPASFLDHTPAKSSHGWAPADLASLRMTKTRSSTSFISVPSRLKRAASVL